MVGSAVALGSLEFQVCVRSVRAHRWTVLLAAAPQDKFSFP